MKIKTFFVLLSMLVIVQLTFATCSSVTVNTDTNVSTATTGTNVTISGTAYSQNSGCIDDISFVSFGQNTGVALDVIDPEGGSYSSVYISPTGTTKTFTVTTSQPDIYFYNVRVGSQLSEPTGVLTYINASDLIVEGNPDTITVSKGDVFTYSVNITNPTNDTVTTFYAVSYPSLYFSLSGGPTSGTISIPAGSSTHLSWEVTVISNNFETANITFQLGDNTNAFTSKILRENPLRPKPIELPYYGLCETTIKASVCIKPINWFFEKIRLIK